jgi:hypothetical protein
MTPEATTSLDEDERLKKEAKTLKARRNRWLDLRWLFSAKDNQYVNTRDGFNVVVYRHAGHWAACVTHCATGAARLSEREYPTSRAAKLAAFDAMIEMKKQREAAERERIENEMVSTFLESRS